MKTLNASGQAPSGHSPGAFRSLLRIGAVPYLNAKILVWGLEQAHAEYALSLAEPSVLARRLRAGELDMGMVSSIEYFRNADYRIVPGFSICGFKEMWSIKLFHRGRLAALKTVGLDPASETSNAFLLIVLRERFGLEVEARMLRRGEEPLGRDDLDGFLKIGDPCLGFRAPGYQMLDLVGAWHDLTGLPFVFALWLVRGEVDLGGFEARLAEAREAGVRHAGEIARMHADQVGLSEAAARTYMTEIVRYGLGPAELAGFMRFKAYLLKHGLLDRDRTLAFYAARPSILQV